MRLVYLSLWIGMAMLGAGSPVEEMSATTTSEGMPSVTTEAVEISVETLTTQTEGGGTPTVSATCEPGRECIDKVTMCGTSIVFYGG